MESILKSIQKEGHPRANHIVFGKEVNHQNVDWTLGAAMYINKKQVVFSVCYNGGNCLKDPFLY